VAYQLSLLESPSTVHDVLHVSQLKKYLQVLEEKLATEDLEDQEDLTYIEKPTQIRETVDSHSKNHQDVQSQMGPPFRGRSNMGKGGSSESQIS
jgi:tRNA nucleotidyltransferase (CCA-adding enzyme)